MTRKEKIKDASWLYCPGQFNGDAAIRSAYQEGADWADKNPYCQYYTMDNCPNCRLVLFYNPYHNNYFAGELDGEDNLVIDNEIKGKVSEFNYLYWTNLPEVDKDNVINYNK